MGKVGQVTIRCAKTGRPLDTGVRLDEAALAVLAPELRLAPRCPHCGGWHRWLPRDAFVDLKYSGEDRLLGVRPTRG